MTKKILLTVILSGFIPSFLFSQEIARLKIYTGDFDRKDCPVYVSLDPINDRLGYDTDSTVLHLYEVKGRAFQSVRCQRDNDASDRLWFVLDGLTPKHTERTFVLKIEKKDNRDSALMKISKSYNTLTLQKDSRNILAYQHRTVLPPAGVDPIYRKSGFIHPLWSPGGKVLTRIQPPDHRHHYGIWGPWTKTHIDGREVDFWNLGKGEGTVRFAGFLSLTAGTVFCGFKAHQEHIDFGGRGEDHTALNEVLAVRAWDMNENAWLIDYTTTQNCPLSSGILLDAYRYGGGIGFRATGKWEKDNCTVLTSEGKDRKSADGTKARWCRVEGESGKGRSGILFMSYPSNREFPEPMRVWPLNANSNRGDLFFEFCPIRHKSWHFERGKDYTLKYRLYVYDGALSAKDAEMIWQGFAHPPVVIMEPLLTK